MKKIFAVMLALAMVLTMVACGKKATTEAKDKIGSAQTGMELYVTTAENGDKTVVDKSGKTAEGYMLDKSGNIVDKAGQVIVAADKVQQLPVKATEDKPAEDKTEPDTKTDAKPTEDSKPDTGSNSESSDSGFSFGSGSSDGGSSGSSSSEGSSSDSGNSGSSTPVAPDPTPVHQHSWEPVYKTVEDYEMREISYCVTCGQDMTGWSNAQLIEHSDYHLDRGESDQWRSEGRQVKVGEHQEIDYYICSCGATKAP